MTKVVINVCYGGFGISDAAVHAYAERKGLTLYPEPTGFMRLVTYWTKPPEDRGDILSGENWRNASVAARIASNQASMNATLTERDIPRDDPDLVAVVEALGAAANGDYAKLVVVDVPDDAQWEISEYDGMEHVAESHRTWS